MTKRPFITLYVEKPWGDVIVTEKYFPTYREAQKSLKKILLRGGDEHGKIHSICVTRFKRGEWGEWFERWELCDGKPQIIKQGWM